MKFFTADYEEGAKPGTWNYVIFTPDGEEHCAGARVCTKEEMEKHLQKICKRSNADLGGNKHSWRSRNRWCATGKGIAS